MEVNPLINPILLKTRSLQKLQLLYKQVGYYRVHDIRILQSPFKTIEINNFFKKVEFVKRLANEIKKIELEPKSNDLYNLHQSSDLNSIRLNPTVKKFVSLMRSHIFNALSFIIGIELQQNISMTVSKYVKGDYLLCHDDKCESRHLAFVLYLSDTNWELEDGGLLTLFNHDKGSMQPTTEERKILPTFNSMVLFEVNNYTYHQVSEVISDKERWSINGWFHSNAACNLPELDYHYISSEVLSVEGKNIDYKHLINTNYEKPSTINIITTEFSEARSVSLAKFLDYKFYCSCLEELKSNINWKEVGPANHRKYFTATNFNLEKIDEDLPTNISLLVSIFCSPNFADFISKICNIRLNHANGSRFPMSIEIQRWTKGCYTLLADNDVFQGLNFIDVILFFNPNAVLNGPNDEGGNLIYLNDQEGERILTPMSNGLIISDYDQITKKFTHYIDSKSHSGDYYALSVSFLSEESLR